MPVPAPTVPPAYVKFCALVASVQLPALMAILAVVLVPVIDVGRSPVIDHGVRGSMVTALIAAETKAVVAIFSELSPRVGVGAVGETVNAMMLVTASIIHAFADVPIFQRNIAGSAVPADPNCQAPTPADSNTSDA